MQEISQHSVKPIGADPIAGTEEGTGDVRGLTVDGINSRWGSVTRSTQDSACWVGADFEICAR